MNITTKVFLSCAFGAEIGTLLALQFNQYLSWLGATLGYFAGGVLIGAVSGGLIGVVHHHLAEKFVPQTTR